MGNGDVEKCIIYNISSGGAEIIRYFIDELPHTFNFQIDKDISVKAKIVWNRGMNYGIMFCFDKKNKTKQLI
jgi:hypothetical protein